MCRGRLAVWLYHGWDKHFGGITNTKIYISVCMHMLCYTNAMKRQTFTCIFYELRPFPGSRDICQVFRSGDTPQSSGISQGSLKVVPGPGSVCIIFPE